MDANLILGRRRFRRRRGSGSLWEDRALGSNHIYFVSPTGNDSNTGLTTTAPWQTGAKLRSTLVAGDIAYLRGGIYTDVDPAYSTARAAWIQIWGSNINSGTANHSIGVLSYPGESSAVSPW